MAQQIEIDPSAITGADEDGVMAVLPDLAYRRLGIVNVVLAGPPGGPWTLIDAGLPGTQHLIEHAAQTRFGGRKPEAIVMTHGHFDHVGVLESLAAKWDVPVYAHADERPYLDGSAAYPPPDPHVGGGLMARLSPLYPRSPVDVGDRLRILSPDGSLPTMPGWRWLHTPGHSAGHISLWREADRALIVGDAFITTAQESAYAAATQAPELHGPPMYFTHDWQAARDSVRRLAALSPELAVTGHGRAMHGAALRQGLESLAARFDEVAVPRDGTYVRHPARAADGSAYR